MENRVILQCPSCKSFDIQILEGVSETEFNCYCETCTHTFTVIITEYSGKE